MSLIGRRWGGADGKREDGIKKNKKKWVGSSLAD